MATIIRMPSVLAGSEEAAIANWLVSEGQTIAVGDPLAEIETEKAVVEYNAEDSGIVGRVLLEAGESGEIGAPIAVLIAQGEGAAEIDALLGGAAAPQEAVSPTEAPEAEVARDPDAATPVQEAPSLERAAQDAAGSTPQTSPPLQTSLAVPTPEPVGSRDGSRLFVSPIARKLAREKGIDPSTVVGTGPDGRIVRRDVEDAVRGAGTARPVPPVEVAEAAETAQPAPVVQDAPPQGPGYEVVPHSGMRKAIARRLTESKSTVPHFYLTTACRVDELIALRARVNDGAAVRVSLNDLVVKAVAAAFATVPEANVTWSDEGMHVHRSVDIAVAVATDGGLVTPVVRGVETKSLSAVSAAIADLVSRAKEKKLKQNELEGGSFSVSNLGMYGTREFSAILNPPQSGILAVGAAHPEAVVVDGAVTVATVMRCTLSVDHRAVDGALAARWLAAFTERIENPLSILV